MMTRWLCYAVAGARLTPSTAGAIMLWSGAASGQSMVQLTTAPTFAPGIQTIVSFDFSGARTGTIPRGITPLSGTLGIATWNGAQMLRATENSELLIYLPQRLPQDFTIEVDLVPKACCPPPDLTLEGTGIINQGQSSAHLLLVTDADHGFVSVIGGAADTYEQALPELIRAALPGVLTRVGVSVAGNTIRFYINGKPIYAHQASFARGHVLRVTLGGSTDDQGAVKPVYLARVRVATGATLVTAINPGTATVTPILPPPAPQPSSPVAPAARTIDLNALTATGTGLRAPVILLPGMQAAGTSTTPARTPFTPATQTIALPPWIGSGGSASIAPRSIALPAFTASAGSTGLRPRTIQLPAFTASGSGPP